MASTSSQGPSPRPSPHDFGSNGDSEESWQYLDFDYGSSSSAPGSVGFLPSPSVGSLNSYAIVGPMSTPPAEASSAFAVPGDLDQPGLFTQNHAPRSRSGEIDAAGMPGGLSIAQNDWSHTVAFMPPQQYLFDEGNDIGPITQQDLDNMASLFNVNLQEDLNSLASFDDAQLVNQGFGDIQSSDHSPSLSHQDAMVPIQYPTVASADQSWTINNNGEGTSAMFVMEDPSASPLSGSAVSSSPSSSGAPSERSAISPARLRKVRTGKIEKKGKKTEQTDNFVIVTPNSISAQSGRPNPYECFEHMRASHKGRKGPLANATKESALQVRRLGACFCCHSRKVKCDKERPCKNCKKLAVSVPQVICWQFQDFLTVLFPEVIRSHLRKDEVARFINENVEGFLVNGVEQHCEVELFSGPTFTSTLTLRAQFFTAKTAEALLHWHALAAKDQVDLQSNNSLPIGAELVKGHVRDDLKKRTKAYIQQIIEEPNFAAQVTDSLRSTPLPRKILVIVQTFAHQTESPIVKKALSIYGMHYILTRHLCLTQQSVYALGTTGLVPHNLDIWVTPRVLARQVKSLIDELMQREMQQLFDLFSKSLKPKHRQEWAPCLAAFLILCLFMEAVETTTDNFVVTDNEVSLRNGETPKFKRGFAIGLCKEVENMPFKQFAYQFHNIYQTHSKDANTKSFNPLLDHSCIEQGEIDGPARHLVLSLRELYHGPDWQDMQFLAADDLVISREEHPFPRDSSLVYTGRLLAKFLLSFHDENAIFGSRI